MKEPKKKISRDTKEEGDKRGKGTAKQSTLCTTQYTLAALYQIPVDSLRKKQKECKWKIDLYLEGERNKEREGEREVENTCGLQMSHPRPHADTSQVLHTLLASRSSLCLAASSSYYASASSSR